MKKKKSIFAFTLIELIVVIAVLALLAAIAVPNFLGLVEKSRKSVFISDISVMESIIKNYQILRDQPPQTNVPNAGSMTDAQWNEYAKNHLDSYIIGGWPVNTPFGGYYAYRAYPDNWSGRQNWQRVYGSGNVTDIVGNSSFEIVMIRFVNPSDEKGFQRAIDALEDSPFKERLYRYSSQYNIGILIP